jgi:alkylation response protein AidB-like acyl-CoA dehydrogenase
MSHPADALSHKASTAAQALAAAGDAESARDVGALDSAAVAAQQRLARTRNGLVERLIYGPTPAPAELQSGTRIGTPDNDDEVVRAALHCLAAGRAFTADGKIAGELRAAVTKAQGYGFTVPAEFGGRGQSYGALARVEEQLAAHGMGALAVEISGELTIGAGSLLAYGTQSQRATYLPMIAQGRLMAFALTEVRIGVNAKKVRAYVEPDPAGRGYRLFAAGDRNKLWITNATHGALAGVVARIGKDGKDVGLFVVELPPRDVQPGADGADYTFTLTPSGADAFQPNFNARVAFDNFPIPQHNRIEADGVEVLFYCLRMGRCMLAAMAAGYQRMFAADASNYARQRDGVGGPVIRHELPRLALGKMLGGALQARALAHLALQQDADGVDLAGLRDLTKSAASGTAMESLLACERVLGGRSFDQHARVNAARANVHVFGVVEGEDDLILMGMVKDVTASFTDRYLAGLLGVISAINVGADGKPLPKDQLILRIGTKTLLRAPRRCLRATGKLVAQTGFWRLLGWVAHNAALDVLRAPLRLLPASWLPRYAPLPAELRGVARYAERRLRAARWTYLGINLWFQLELTRAQIPLQRFGKLLEHLASMVALCWHASKQDVSQQRVAALQCTLLREKAKGIRLLSGLLAMEQTRRLTDAVGRDLEAGAASLLHGVTPQPFAHAWGPDAKGR